MYSVYIDIYIYIYIYINIHTYTCMPLQKQVSLGLPVMNAWEPGLLLGSSRAAGDFYNF